MTELTAEQSAKEPIESHTDLAIECIHGFEELSLQQEAWDAFVEQSHSDIYFTFNWLRTWWQYYGRNRKLRFFIVRHDGQMVAALPLHIQRFWLSPLSLRVARFVGSDSTISVFSPPIAAGYEQSVLRLLFDQLFNLDRCDMVSLSPLSGESSIALAAREACAGNGDYQIIHADSHGPHTLFKLPETFDDYLMGLKKKQRSNYRRDLKQLSNRYKLDHRILTGDEGVRSFDRFTQMHAAQWNAAGRAGHFGDWPQSEAFNRELIEKEAPMGRAFFYEITGDGKPLSIQYGFLLADRFYWRLPARDPDPELQKLGLGRLGLVLMLEALIEEGVRYVEAGPGHYDYKLKHGGEELPLGRLLITRSAPASRFKTALLLLWADLINLVYYRIWLIKLRPWLGMTSGQLWGPWIRTRL